MTTFRRCRHPPVPHDRRPNRRPDPRGRFPARQSPAVGTRTGGTAAVSRASIREALIALEIEGYVEVRVGSGVFVTAREGAAPPAPAPAAGAEDIGPFDLLEARMLIEPECAALAAQQATPAQLAAIRAAHEGMSLTDMPGQHDRAFHSAIAAACGNAALAASVAHLWNLSQSSPVFSRMQDYFVNTKVWKSPTPSTNASSPPSSPATRSARAMPCMCT